jgi:hypothetical protein
MFTKPMLMEAVLTIIMSFSTDWLLKTIRASVILVKDLKDMATVMIYYSLQHMVILIMVEQILVFLLV